MEEENDQPRLQLSRQIYSVMSGLFETRVENLETPAPSPAVRSLSREKKKKSKKRKAVSFEDSDEDSSDDKKLPSKKKFYQYHGK